MVVRVDEAGHDDAAAGVDHRGIAGVQVRSDGDDLLALDQDVGLGEIADVRVQRHHGAAADDVAPAAPAGVVRCVVAVRGGRAWPEETGPGGGHPGDGGVFQEIAPRAAVALWVAVIA